MEKTKAEYAEVWFRIEWEERYGELFEYLKKNKINFGLHFWAEIEGGFLPNLAYEKNNIAQKTEAAVRKNIDIAQKAGAYYVNIHPGALTLEQVDLNKMEAKVVPESKISYEESLFTLKKHCLRLNRYAKEKTDSHHGTLPQDFAQNVVPNKEQLRELLALFKNRDDVWVIPEPKAELMAENYFEAKRMFNI